MSPRRGLSISITRTGLIKHQRNRKGIEREIKHYKDVRSTPYTESRAKRTRGMSETRLPLPDATAECFLRHSWKGTTASRSHKRVFSCEAVDVPGDACDVCGGGIRSITLGDARIFLSVFKPCSPSRFDCVFVCVCACVFFPFILDIKFVGCTSWGHTTRGLSAPYAIHAF